jgi:glycosyltransferase involved in cell wall biosynthesis
MTGEGREPATAVPGAGGAPRFAITMTVWNNAATILRSLDSLRGDLAEDGELAIADGGSTDGTFELLRRWSAEVPRVSLVAEGPCNRGVGRNRAIARTSAPLVCTHVDGDNAYEPGVIRAAALALEGDARTAALSVVGRDDANPSSTRFFVWRRSVLDGIGGYPGIQSPEDLGLVLRAFRAGVRIRLRLVPRVAVDLQARETGHGSSVPAWRRGPSTVRAARKFALLGFTFSEYVRYLSISRRTAPRFVAGAVLGALGYLIFLASGRSADFLRTGSRESPEEIARILASDEWPQGR